MPYDTQELSVVVVRCEVLLLLLGLLKLLAQSLLLLGLVWIGTFWNLSGSV